MNSMTEWRTTTIGEQVTLQRGIDITKAQQRPGKVPVVSSGGIASYHDTPYAKGPGVILGRKGTLGTVFFLNTDYWPHDTTLWVRDFHGNDAKFVYYFFTSMSARLLALDVGSANPALNRNHVHPIMAYWPPLDEQRAIARSLGALDDKIELNRRMNRTLETIAQAIFKSWFVDFDPVIAKRDGRKPVGMDDTTAALFPSHFQESDMGPIPSGWEKGSTADIAKYVNGRNFTKNASGTGRMVIRIAELNSGPAGSTIYNDVKAEPENVAFPDDLLFSWSGSLDIYRWHRDEALVNQHIFKVICEKFPQWFVYYHLREAISFFRGIAADKATTMGHIKREHLSQTDVALPPRKLVVSVSQIIQPLYERMHRNERQIITLASLRDTLLPQLLSGELRVGQAEKMVENA